MRRLESFKEIKTHLETLLPGVDLAWSGDESMWKFKLLYLDGFEMGPIPSGITRELLEEEVWRTLGRGFILSVVLPEVWEVLNSVRPEQSTERGNQ